MEIKIQCYCGTKYKFDVEPVNGRIPFAVKCPQCGVDASEFANGHVQQSLGIASPPASGVLLSVAQATVAAEPPSVPATTTASEPRLRVRKENSTPPASTAASEPDAPPPPPVAPRRFTRPVSTFASEEDPGMTPRFLLGVLGGVLGAIVGCLIWYLIFHFTGTHLRLLAIIVGFTAGLGARLLSKDEGSTPLGVLTALAAFVGIVLTAYFIGRERAHDFAGSVENTLYQEQVAYAKRAVKAVPNGTDDEIRLFLAKEDALDDEKPDPKAVTAEEIREFRTDVLPEMKALASGQKQFQDNPEDDKKAKEVLEEAEAEVGAWMKFVYFFAGWGIGGVGIMFITLGLAYKVCTHA